MVAGVPVDIGGDADRAVPEQVREGLDVHARFEPHRRRGVPQAVHADALDGRRLRGVFDHPEQVVRVDRRAEFGGEHQPGSAAPPTTPRIKLFHGLTWAKKTRPRRATAPDFPGYTASPQGPDNYFETALNSARAQSTWSYTAARPAVLLSLVRQKWVPVLRARNTLRDHRLSVRGLNFEVLSLRWRGRRGLGHGVRKPDALVCPVRLVAVNTGAKSCAPEAWFAGRHLSAVGQALPRYIRG